MRNLPMQSFKEAQRTRILRMKRAQILTTYERACRGSSRSKCASAPDRRIPNNEHQRLATACGRVISLECCPRADEGAYTPSSQKSTFDVRPDGSGSLHSNFIYTLTR